MNTDYSILEIDEQFLTDYWDKYLGFENGLSATLAKQNFIKGVKSAIGDNIDESRSLQLETSGYKIKIKASLMRSIITAPFIASILPYIGATDIPANVLLSLLPSIIDVENIELSNEEDEIRISLPLKKHEHHFRSPEKWYNDLPRQTREKLRRGAFKDLLEKWVYAGLAEHNSKGNYIIFQKGKGKFKLSIVL